MNSLSAYTNDELTLMLRDGDRTAFTELYNRYWEKLFAIAFNYSKQKQAAEEIVQEVFMRLWDKRDAIEIKEIGAYLATAVKFGVFKQLAREKRRKELINQNIHPLPDTDEEAIINARFLQEYVNGVVEQLPEQCRIVYRLNREQGLSTAEIAQKLNISPKTAGNHLNKALRMIRTSLKSHHNWLLLMM